MRLLFGKCVLDLDARELQRGGSPVSLTPKAMQLLSLLLENRPRAVAQDELRDALWPDSHVGYTSLAGVVAEVRKAIGDSGRPWRFIRTLSRFGYAFAGDVVSESRTAGEQAAGAFVSEEREYPLSLGETLVGRGDECGVRLLSTQVSRVHARVEVTAGGGVRIEDLKSKNGTWVNAERRHGVVELYDGDEVMFGTFRVRFRRAGSPGPTRTGEPR